MLADLICPAGHRFALAAPSESGSTPCPQCGILVVIDGSTSVTCDWSAETRDPGPHRPLSIANQPQRLGRFELRSKAGEGASGVVYRAYDPQLDREVALKVPRAGLIEDAEDVAAFLREGRAAGKLRHPNIVPVHDAGHADGWCYIVSALIDGQTLKQAIESGQPFSPVETASLVVRLAQALHYAHEKGLVHRDVKPGNIMLDSTGEPIVMDFGLARRSLDETLQTVGGDCVGTPAYMSPEQASGKSNEADARADQWALGVLLYELLTGKRPFGGSATQLFAAIQTQEPVQPRRLKRSIPRDVETICLKCLAKDPAKRYASCQLLADDLGRFLRGEPIQARRTSRVERVARWCRRNPALAGAMGVAALLLIAAIGLVVNDLAFRSEASETAKRLSQDVTTREKSEQAAKAKMLAESQRADTESRMAQRRICEKKLNDALAACEKGDIDHGLLLMVDALENAASAKAPELDRVVRLNIAAWLPELTTLTQVLVHDHSPTTVAYGEFSKDGGRFIGGGHAKHHVWDTASGKLLATGNHPNLGMLAYGWGAEEKTIIAGYANGIGRFDAATGKLLGDGKSGLAAPYRSVVLSPDRRRMAACSPTPGKMHLWNAETGQRIAAKDQPGVVCAAFSPDSTKLVTGGQRDLKLWDAETGAPLPSKFPDRGALELKFTSDGRRLLASAGDARLMELDTGRELGRIGQFSLFQMNVALTDSMIALNADDRSIVVRKSFHQSRLYDLLSGEEFAATFTHEGSVYSHVFSPDGRLLLTHANDGKARLWTKTGQPIGQPLRHIHPSVVAIGFSEDGRQFFSGDISAITKLWKPPAVQRDGRRLPVLKGTPFKSIVAVSAEGTLVYRSTRTAPTILEVWNAHSGQQLRRVTLSESLPDNVQLSVSPDTRKLACWEQAPTSANRAPTIRQWDLTTGERIGGQIAVARLRVHPDWAGYDATGKHLLVSSRIGAYGQRGDIIDAETGASATANWPADIDPYRFSPDGRNLLYMRGRSLLVCHWPLPGGQRPAGGSEIPLDGSVIDFSPAGTAVIASNVSGVRVWNVSLGRFMGRTIARPLQAQKYAVTDDGRLLALADASGEVRLWDTATGVAVGPILAGPGPRRPKESTPVVNRLSFAEGDTKLLACYSDSVLNGPMGTLIYSYQIPEFVNLSDETLKLEVEARTGCELDAEGGVKASFDSTWRTRNQQLAALGKRLRIAGESASPGAQIETAVEEQPPAKLLLPDQKGWKLLFQDEFDNPASGFRVLENAEFQSKSEYVDGRFVIRNGQKNFASRSSPWTVQNFACLVRGRLVGGPSDYWSLVMARGTPEALTIHVRADGLVSLTRADHPETVLVAPGKATAEEFHDLLAIVRGRRVEVYFDGVAARQPIFLESELPPVRLQLGYKAYVSGRAEFENMLVWDAGTLAAALPTGPLATLGEEQALFMQEEYQRGLLEAHQQQFGFQDRRTREVMASLAATLSSRGRLHAKHGHYPTARELLDVSLAMYQEAGVQREVAGKRFDLGWVAEREGKLEEARELFRKSAAEFEQARYPSGARVARQRLAGVIAAQALQSVEKQDFQNAEAHWRTGWELRTELEPEIWTTFETQSLLGQSLVKQGQAQAASDKPAAERKFAAAEPLLVAGFEGLKQRQKQIPADQRTTVTAAAVRRLVELYRAWERPDEAARWEKVLADLTNEPKP